MTFGLSKVSRLAVQSLSHRNRKNTYNCVTHKFYAKSPFFLKIMSNSFNVGALSSHVEQAKKENQEKENVHENLIKSDYDAMEYRLIQLENGLRAILISDVLKIVDLDAISADVEESEEESTEEESDNSSYEEVQSDIVSEEEDSDTKLVVKEAEEKMAACALCVGVGSFSDPHDIPGLAHFLEHMVFMGSSKYPQENGFDEFIKKHGGSDNGSTDCETTTFYLECSEKYLKEGMNRFAQFFISPLMKREAMTREREIIHSEFEMSLPSDRTRREQILGSFAPSGHPAAKFLWGNSTTLNTNVDDNVLYDRVHEFRKRHYSAHRMTVAVQGRLPLDTLEEYVRESFSDIPSNGLPSENFTEYIGTYGNPNNFNKMVWVKPVRDICQVHLTWVLPSFMKEYKCRPLDYVAWLIGHEGEGSLLSLLRQRVWALECEAGNDESGFEHNSIYSLFSVSIILTEEGYKCINEVVGLVFSYISMLKKNCPNKEIFNELRTVCETNFRNKIKDWRNTAGYFCNVMCVNPLHRRSATFFCLWIKINHNVNPEQTFGYKTEIPSSNYVEILAESMHFYEPKHYIAGGELYLEYKPELITEILNFLTPDRVNVIIYSKENRDSFYDKIEPWFQTKYKILDIPSELKNKWWKASPLKEFHIPRPNPYLVTDFSLLEGPESNPPYPTKILDSDLLELWYRQDVKFRQPLAYFSFYIMTPLLKTESLNAVLLDVLSAYLEAKLTEQMFPANEAGLFCTFYPADLGLFLHFNGYNQKLPLLIDEILRSIHDCCGNINDPSNVKLFEALKKGRSRAYYNKLLKPKKLVKMARLSLLVENFETSVEYLNVMDRVTLERLHGFAREFLGCVRILGLVQGNVSKESALSVCGKFETVLRCSALVGERPQVRVTKLNKGELYLRLKSFNDSDSNSVVVNYYQVGPENIRTSCMIDLIMMLMDEPLFDNLRTKQQIGYDVHCLLRDTFGILGFSVTVFFQSHKFEPDEVDQRIETFLEYFSKTLKAMPKKEWEETKASLVLLKSSADLQLQDEVKRNFVEIYLNDCKFDRLKKEVEIIPDISHKELCNWFVDHISGGKNFKKLSVQVVGNSKENCESKDSQENVPGRVFKLKTMTSDNANKDLFVTDIAEYKSKREFYPFKKKT